jgi:methyltransferase (TIGR00027 family)
VQEGKSSSTAWGVTLARVAHVRFDESPPIFDDSLAFELVEPEIQPMLTHYGPKEESQDDPQPSPAEQLRRARAYLPLRQRYQEECLAAAYERGVRQFVLLGAGLDSYAFRQEPGRADLTIFEVDFPATQAEKRARIAKLGWPEPANLRFAPCDFEGDTLESALLQAGFDPSRSSYFAWMGVTIYLEHETVRSSLGDVLSLSAPGSSIAFEFALPTVVLSGTDLLSREHSLAQKNREREPFKTYFRLEEIREMVSDVGWKRFEALDHEETATRVLAGRTDDLSIHMGFRLAEAFA